ncbi:indole-3-glycerol phosphate synthase TrpC [Paenibacillus sp. CGMCC 1.16610]|uniref:Indole-3-glycerol phosphate synthase n=1 Tax=Paenibacillus anseongense TaxID=2682845 RepID=A0ABW9UE49_9BACL|nr:MULTISPECIES: indole-3-glycerol phosphate synthase TrpC [Paenibacillus]MBA2942289.1 indole-3-glycerol phosphate synthase TrpC [Paenibacillus sp. CGMCC 1.16610]MVQ36120.1 indole-3-glycerol phosphate synthase TrpC [Paenibacillus anseongense]
MFLDKIVATKRTEVEAMSSFSIAQAEKTISEMPSCLGFEKALTTRKNRAMGLVAEVKKASPSKGLIREDFDPVLLASSYQRAGADCISVLTDVDYFQGSNAYLKAVRQAVNVPLLRKDFTIDPKQIYEARLIGADAILLIAAILTTDQMKQYLKLASDLGLDALVEVHDREELERALELDTQLIGINNRNLKTFVTDLKTTEELIQYIPAGKTIVSESGISSVQDMAYLQQIGSQAVLIGEHFMRQPVVEQAVHDLMGSIVNTTNQTV